MTQGIQSQSVLRLCGKALPTAKNICPALYSTRSVVKYAQVKIPLESGIQANGRLIRTPQLTRSSYYRSWED